MNAQTEKKALIYVRVSTERQAREGYSLDAQEKLCRKFANDKGYKILTVYKDEGKSATNLNRPALQNLLDRCQEDKHVDFVIVQETDRLARNIIDHFTIKALFKKTGTKLISVAQPMMDDSAEGDMIDGIFACVNQFGSDQNSRKTRKGLQEKFNCGWWPGWAPLGYLNERHNEKNIIVKDKEKWFLVMDGFKMYLTGNYSALEIIDTLYKKGLKSKTGKKISNSTMTSILRNPFYAGIMRWNKQEKTGRHEKMITQDEHKEILTIMSTHNNHACRRRTHSFLLRGFVFCDICGQRYTAEKHRVGKNPDYYHCAAKRVQHSNKGQNVEVKELERQVEEQFKNIQFSKEFINLIVQKVKKLYQERKDKKEINKRILLNKKMGFEEKKITAERKLISGVLADEDFIGIRDRLKEEITNIKNQIDELETKQDADIDTIREVLLLSNNVYDAYKKAPYKIKRLYLAFFWEGFWAKNKKIVKSQPTELIKILKNKKKIIIRDNWLRRKDSNLQPSA